MDPIEPRDASIAASVRSFRSNLDSAVTLSKDILGSSSERSMALAIYARLVKFLRFSDTDILSCETSHMTPVSLQME